MEPALLLKAIDFAARKHRFQRRRDPEASPYINHPIAVAALVAEVGGVTDPATIVAAVLHDTVEDTKTSFEELSTAFGAEVSGIVEKLTDDKSLPKAERKLLQIRHAPGAPVAAKIVKLADKICNVIDISETPPPDWDLTRQFDYLAWSKAVIDGCRGVNGALEARFDEVVERGCQTMGSDFSALLARADSMKEAASRMNE